MKQAGVGFMISADQPTASMRQLIMLPEILPLGIRHASSQGCRFAEAVLPSGTVDVIAEKPL